MQAVTKLTEFELTTIESISYFTRVKINAELVVTERGALIAKIDEDTIKGVIEAFVGKSIELTPKGNTKGAKE
jgi:hypothetical protein